MGLTWASPGPHLLPPNFPPNQRYKSFPRHGYTNLLHPLPAQPRIIVMATTPAKRKPASEDTSTSKPLSSKRKRPSTPEDYFKIRGVLQHKNGKYLVDWEDHPNTGEKYTPTWEPKKNLNKEALHDWKQTQTKQRAEEREALKRKKSKKRSNESQQSYDDTSLGLTRERLLKRRVLERSPTYDSSVVDEGENTIGASTQLHQIEQHPPTSASPRASSQIFSHNSDNWNPEGRKRSFAPETSSSEAQHEPKENGSVGQATSPELEILLSQKSFDRDEYSSISAPATQTTPPASSVPSAQAHPLVEGESSTKNIYSTQEIPHSTQNHTGDPSRGSIYRNAILELTAKSALEHTEAVTRDSLTSVPATESQPSHESYRPPPTTSTQIVTESSGETVDSKPSSPYQIPSVETISRPSEKIVPDSQGLENRETSVTTDDPADPIDAPFITTSGRVRRDQISIPEGSPIEVLPSYVCFRAWKDQHVFVDVKISRD